MPNFSEFKKEYDLEYEFTLNKIYFIFAKACDDILIKPDPEYLVSESYPLFLRNLTRDTESGAIEVNNLTPEDVYQYALIYVALKMKV